MRSVKVEPWTPVRDVIAYEVENTGKPNQERQMKEQNRKGI